MTPRKVYRLGLTMALAGGLGIAAFSAPALANAGGVANHGNSGGTPAVANANNNSGHSSQFSQFPGSKKPGSEGNAPSIPPGILGNTHAKGVCSDFATGNGNQGRGKSKNGNPAHDCSGGVTPTTVAPTTVTTVAPTAVLGETITAPAAPTAAAPAAAPTAVQKLPFTGPGHVGTLAGLGFSTLLLGGGLVLATRRQPLATIGN